MVFNHLVSTYEKAHHAGENVYSQRFLFRVKTVFVFSHECCLWITWRITDFFFVLREDNIIVRKRTCALFN